MSNKHVTEAMQLPVLEGDGIGQRKLIDAAQAIEAASRNRWRISVLAQGRSLALRSESSCRLRLRKSDPRAAFSPQFDFVNPRHLDAGWA